MSTCRALLPGRRGAAILVLAFLLALAACTADPGHGASGRPEATATTVPAASDRALPPPPPHPTDDAASAQAALDTGIAAVAAFARPHLPADLWWAQLAPLLTPAAAGAYAGTDPAQVPARAIVGPAWGGESPSPFLATTFVPTDAGDYAVLLVRDGGGAPWLVERITLVPAGASGEPTDGDRAP